MDIETDRKRTMGRIDVETYFDPAGNRTCANDFAHGNVCKFYRTQRFGTLETCVFAPQRGRYAEQLQRRGDDGKGSLIPAGWCPIVANTRQPKPPRARFLRPVPWKDIGLALIAAIVFCLLLALEPMIAGI